MDINCFSANNNKSVLRDGNDNWT